MQSDLWWMRTFNEPPERRDDADEGRVMRAMEFAHVTEMTKRVQTMDDPATLADLVENDDKLLKEIIDAEHQ